MLFLDVILEVIHKMCWNLAVYKQNMFMVTFCAIYHLYVQEIIASCKKKNELIPDFHFKSDREECKTEPKFFYSTYP